jgi:hypothetical protein
MLHPLLHRDASDASGRRFVSTFRGDEPFLADHVVKGARVLPGVAYLEMARAAVVHARGIAPNRVCLENVAWSRPFTVGDEPVSLHVALDPEEADAIGYEIFSEGSSPDERVVHSQGVAVVQDAPAIPPVNLAALRARCEGAPLSRAQCYGAFRAIGLEYGPTHRGLERVAVGADADGRRFVLADVSITPSDDGTSEDYVLHPGVMDAALQAPIGWMMGDAAMKPALPFALGELRIIAPCPSRAVVVVREASDSTNRVRKLDIAICDAAGNVCVRLEDFSARVLDGPVRAEQSGTLLLVPRLEVEPARAETATAYAAHWVVLCEVDGDVAGVSGVQLVRLRADGNVAQRFESHAAALLQLVQRILAEKPKGEVLLQLVVPAGGEGWLFSGLSGLLKTAQMEHPKLITQTIGVAPAIESGDLARSLRENSGHRGDAVIRYSHGTRSVARFKETTHAQ